LGLCYTGTTRAIYKTAAAKAARVSTADNVGLRVNAIGLKGIASRTKTEVAIDVIATVGVGGKVLAIRHIYEAAIFNVAVAKPIRW
jgi:hypothetical protein